MIEPSQVHITPGSHLLLTSTDMSESVLLSAPETLLCWADDLPSWFSLNVALSYSRTWVGTFGVFPGQHVVVSLAS